MRFLHPNGPLNCRAAAGPGRPRTFFLRVLRFIESGVQVMASHIRQQMRRRMRLPLRRVLKDEQPERPVLCYEELDTKLNIRVMERVSLPETHP
jgi:hypothetical protein